MLQYIYPSHRHDARTLTQIKGQIIQKRLTLKPPPSKTHTIKQMRKTELNVKHRVQNQCVLGLDMTSRLIGTGHFRPPVLGPSKGQLVCCAMGAHKGTYNPDSHLHSTTRIPSSDPTGLHPRPTGGPF